MLIPELEPGLAPSRTASLNPCLMRLAAALGCLRNLVEENSGEGNLTDRARGIKNHKNRWDQISCTKEGSTENNTRILPTVL